MAEDNHAAMRHNRSESADMITMQQDAVRRVRQMQRMARERVAAGPRVPMPTATPMSADRHTASQDQALASEKKEQAPDHLRPPSSLNEFPPETQELPPRKRHENFLTDLLHRLNLDHETIVLLAVLLVLVNEGADMTIILAVCYLLF